VLDRAPAPATDVDHRVAGLVTVGGALRRDRGGN